MTASSTSGVLVVNKAPGLTSFQVVAFLRRILRAPKVGHGGTLDPEAAGVLPILVNEATKLTPYLAEHAKEYVATVKLGVVTDTQDLTGTVLRVEPIPDLTPIGIQEVLARFVGQTQQIPPMYSALHVGGKRLYQLARRGLEVPREPRPVMIHALTLEAIDLPRFTVRVVCGKGTYVRALCADLGEAIGCGAALERLLRTRVGPYSLEAALPWAEVAQAGDGEALWTRLLPPDSAVSHLPAVQLAEEAVVAFLNGQSVPAPKPVQTDCALVRLYAPSGMFLGLGRLIQTGSALKPERILHGNHPRGRVLPA
jgi:tRNA pseudouridine55 synthase